MSTPNSPPPPTPDRPVPPPSDEPAGHDSWSSVGGVLLAAAAVGVIAWAWRTPKDPHLRVEDASADETMDRADAPAPPPPRCTRVGTSAYRVGRIAAPSEDESDEDTDRVAAFGVEIGRAIPFGSGFAAGVRHDQGDGVHVALVTVNDDASKGDVLDLGAARGDFDAPLLVNSGDGWIAGLLEPHASGVALRIGASMGTASPKWAVELEQGRDESLAFDLVAGPRSAVVAWDDVSPDGKLARVVWSTLDAGASRVLEGVRVASGAGIDAEGPRVVLRPGGFWLAYIARAAREVPKSGDDAALERHPEGDRFAAEKIEPSWLELVPLDENGAANGPARAITPKTGHALAFDLATNDDGSALVAWRDDDTPSGSHGGNVGLMTVTASGGAQEQRIAERDVGTGIPTLLAGWIAVPNAAGMTMLAPIAGDGTMQGDLRVESAIGTGDPLAGRGPRILVATSVSTAVDLSVVECAR